jgi:ADP-ribose pyrophosphatase
MNVNSEYIYKGRVVTLRLDTITHDDGHTMKREVIEHPGAVGIVPMLNADTVLLITQTRYPTGETLLEIPAGTLEPGENPDECAARELIEETGYRAAKLTKLFTNYLAPGYSNELMHIYLAEDLSPEYAQADEDEDIEVVETPISDVRAMVLDGRIKDAKTIAGLMVALS